MIGDYDIRRFCDFKKSNHEFMAFIVMYLHLQFIPRFFLSRLSHAAARRSNPFPLPPIIVRVQSSLIQIGEEKGADIHHNLQLFSSTFRNKSVYARLPVYAILLYIVRTEFIRNPFEIATTQL